MKRAFEDFLNLYASRSAEYLAKYIDMNLNLDSVKKIGTLTEENIKQIIDNSMLLFQFILNKDLFEAFYLKRLSKRLLFKKMVSENSECYLLRLLKAECGPFYTRNAEAMFKDMEINQELNTVFPTYLEKKEKKPSEINFSAIVLTLGCWPIETFPPLSLPIPISEMQDLFEQYYAESNEKKKLNWSLHYSSVTMTGKFDKEYVIEASGLQSLILLQFNTNNRIKYEMLITILGFIQKPEKKQINDIFDSAIYALLKSGLIRKEGMNDSLEKEDILELNSIFSCSDDKIVVTRMHKKEKQDESKVTEEKVLDERKFQVDAAIMKVMKKRKRINHFELTELIRPLLKFQLDSESIKKRIDTLIEREFILRDEKSSNTYIYIY